MYADLKEVEAKIKQAETIKDYTKNSANRDFADGVIAALEWVTGIGDDPFMDF